MNTNTLLKRLLMFFAAFVLLYVLIYLSNFIFWVRRFDYYSFEGYLLFVLVFSFIAANEFWVAAGFFGFAVIAGNIVQYSVIKAQGGHVTMAGGFTFAGIMLTGLIVGIICQFIVSKYFKRKKK